MAIFQPVIVATPQQRVRFEDMKQDLLKINQLYLNKETGQCFFVLEAGAEDIGVSAGFINFSSLLDDDG